MSVKTILISTAVMLASAAPALAESGSVFVNNEIGYQAHPTPSQLSRSQVVNELKRAQQQRGIQYLEVGESSGYPYETSGLADSGKPMTHRGADMPGGQGMMPDHPHQERRR